MNTKDLISDNALKLKDDNIYIAPNIPEKKIINAINSFAKDISINEPLLLIDETIFGSAKDGLILTKNKIYAKGSFESPISFDLNKIKKVTTDKKSEAIIFNDYEFVKLTTPNKNARAELINLLKVLTQIKELGSAALDTPQQMHSNVEIKNDKVNKPVSSIPEKCIQAPLSFARKIGVFALSLLLIFIVSFELYLYKNYNPENKAKLILLLFGIPIGYGLPLAGVGLILGLREKLAIFTSNVDVFLTGIACVVNIIALVIIENSTNTLLCYTVIIGSIILNIIFIIFSYLANKNFLYIFIVIPTKIWCVLILLLLSFVTIGFALAFKENLEKKEYKKAVGNIAGTVASGYSTMLVDKFLHKLVKKGKEINSQVN